VLGRRVGRPCLGWLRTESPGHQAGAVSVAGHQVPNLALYGVDWGDAWRSEQIQISNAVTGAVLDTDTLSRFSGRVYLDWKLSGNVVITVRCLAGTNAVLSGLFLDPTVG
jgi:hypothetical protein